MIGYLKDVLPTFLILMLSITVTPTLFEYMQILLKFPPPARIYRQPLNRPNLTYVVAPIRKARFENLAFIIPSAGTISDISKTMIFIDSIDEFIEMVKYLRSKFSKRIRRIKQSDVIIQTFFANLTIKF